MSDEIFYLSRYFKLGQTTDGVYYPLFSRRGENIEYIPEIDRNGKIKKFTRIYQFGDMVVFHQSAMEIVRRLSENFVFGVWINGSFIESDYDIARDMVLNNQISQDCIGTIAWMQLLALTNAGIGPQRLSWEKFSKKYLRDNNSFADGQTLLLLRREQMWRLIESGDKNNDKIFTHKKNIIKFNKLNVEQMFMYLSESVGDKGDEYFNVWNTLADFSTEAERLYESGVDHYVRVKCEGALVVKPIRMSPDSDQPNPLILNHFSRTNSGLDGFEVLDSHH